MATSSVSPSASSSRWHGSAPPDGTVARCTSVSPTTSNALTVPSVRSFTAYRTVTAQREEARRRRLDDLARVAQRTRRGVEVDPPDPLPEPDGRPRSGDGIGTDPQGCLLRAHGQGAYGDTRGPRRRGPQPPRTRARPPRSVVRSMPSARRPRRWRSGVRLRCPPSLSTSEELVAAAARSSDAPCRPRGTSEERGRSGNRILGRCGGGGLQSGQHVRIPARWRR